MGLTSYLQTPRDWQFPNKYASSFLAAIRFKAYLRFELRPQDSGR